VAFLLYRTLAPFLLRLSVKLLPAATALRPIPPAGPADFSGWGGPGITLISAHCYIVLRLGGCRRPASRTGAATFFTFRIGSSFSARALYSRAFFDLEVVEWPSYARYVYSPKKIVELNQLERACKVVLCILLSLCGEPRSGSFRQTLLSSAE
jgi:hypothetical protein